MTDTLKTQGRIMVYGCGGTGVKRAHSVATKETVDGHADVSVCYIDASFSDLPDSVSSDDCYLLEGTEGSGSERSTNPHIIKSIIKQIPNRFKPQDLNVVIFGGTGGSGSVFGPFLVAELIERGAPVVAIVVLGSVSEKATMNALATLKSLANMSIKADVPFVVMVENNLHNDRAAMAQVDRNVDFNVQALRVLAHKGHIGLDREDVANFLRFNKVTGVPAQLATLTVATNVEERKTSSYPVSVCSINKGATDLGELSPEYYCGGELRNPEGTECDEIMYLISVTDTPAIFKHLEKRLQEIRERSSSRPQVAMAKFESDDDDGMVF